MTQYETRYCTHCGTALAWITQLEDGGDKARLRCPACGWTHWNNPTPVLAAIVEVNGQVLLARNAAWPEKMFALITGFMEAGESPQEGIAREVKEETNLDVQSAKLVGAYEFLRMNQVIIAYHVVATGQVKLSPELVDYRLYDLDKLKCWPAGTGYALADWLRTRGHEPVFLPKKKMQSGAVGWACRARIDDHGNTQRNRYPGLELPFAHSQSQEGLGGNGQRSAVEGVGHRCGVGARFPGVCQANGQ